MAAKYLTLAVMTAGVMAGYKTDPNTTKYRSFWFDSNGRASCQEVVANYVSGTMADFCRWVRFQCADRACKKTLHAKKGV
jgi:hypothetical protein